MKKITKSMLIALAVLFTAMLFIIKNISFDLATKFRTKS